MKLSIFYNKENYLLKELTFGIQVDPQRNWSARQYDGVDPAQFCSSSIDWQSKSYICWSKVSISQ